MRIRRCTRPSRPARTPCGFTARPSPTIRRAPSRLAPQIPISVLDVAAQLLALLRRHLALLLLLLAVLPALVLVDVAHVLAHALALVLAHALVLATAARLAIAALLRKNVR